MQKKTDYAKINLLPPWAKQAKAQRRFIKILAAVQVAIFIVLAGVALLLHTLEERVLAQSRQLSNTIAAFDSAPAEMLAALHAARAEAVYIEQFLEVIPDYFDAYVVGQIIATTPPNVNFLRLDFNGRHFTLLASVSDINTAEVHRQALAEFFDVTLGGLTLVGDAYVYEFQLVQSE